MTGGGGTRGKPAAGELLAAAQITWVEKAVCEPSR